jgi:hypothetical protein
MLDNGVQHPNSTNTQQGRFNMRRDPKEYQSTKYVHDWNKNDYDRQKKSDQPWVPRRRPVEKIVPEYDFDNKKEDQ